MRGVCAAVPRRLKEAFDRNVGLAGGEGRGEGPICDWAGRDRWRVTGMARGAACGVDLSRSGQACARVEPEIDFSVGDISRSRTLRTELGRLAAFYSITTSRCGVAALGELRGGRSRGGLIRSLSHRRGRCTESVGRRVSGFHLYETAEIRITSAPPDSPRRVSERDRTRGASSAGARPLREQAVGDGDIAYRRKECYGCFRLVRLMCLACARRVRGVPRGATRRPDTAPRVAITIDDRPSAFQSDVRTPRDETARSRRAQRHRATAIGSSREKIHARAGGRAHRSVPMWLTPGGRRHHLLAR